MIKKIFIILLFSLGSLISNAQLSVAKIIGHNMVLQQKQPVPVWGTATPGASITVKFQSQFKKTRADSNGDWKIVLDPLHADFNAADMEILSDAGEQIILKNILVGEVWLCSGQSNMEWAMRKLINMKPPVGANWPVNEVAEASNKSIRIFLVKRKEMKPDFTHSGWSEAMGESLLHFSEAGYFFAKELSARLKVPIGMISAAIPGSRIEPWMPEEAMSSQSFFINNKDKAIGKIDGDPGKFYNSMIAPLIPFALKGFLWYQGESNCFLNERLQYSYKMKALIDYWRKEWNDTNKPFYYVQIAPYYYSKAKDRPFTVYSLPEFWEAQAAVLKIPNTAMIATIDLNDDPNDLHPLNKWDIGKRLAHAALVNNYKVQDGAAMGPVCKEADKKRSSIILSFDNVGRKLKSRSGKHLTGFEIEKEPGAFVKANAKIRKDKVIVSAKGIENPLSVRYAWREDAHASLYNNQGLPALPFRTSHSIISEFR